MQSTPRSQHGFVMGLPETPVTLRPVEIDALNRKLSTMRHNINNYLSLVMAATELMRYKPEMVEKMTVTLGEQPNRIIDEIRRFSNEFESTFGITREPPKV